MGRNVDREPTTSYKSLTTSEYAQFQKDFARARESLEKLTGERGDKQLLLSAVRRTELGALARTSMKSAQVTAAPTMSDFNALQIDVKNIYDALKKISNVLGNASISKV